MFIVSGIKFNSIARPGEKRFLKTFKTKTAAKKFAKSLNKSDWLSLGIWDGSNKVVCQYKGVYCD